MEITVSIMLGVLLADTLQIIFLSRKLRKHTDVIAVLCKHALIDILGDFTDEEKKSND